MNRVEFIQDLYDLTSERDWAKVIEKRERLITKMHDVFDNLHQTEMLEEEIRYLKLQLKHQCRINEELEVMKV